MSIAKIETASGVTLVLNGNTVFASDDTSYWLQGAKVIGDDGHVYGHAETIRDALCLVLAKYGGLKGNSARQTKPIKAVNCCGNLFIASDGKTYNLCGRMLTCSGKVISCNCQSKEEALGTVVGLYGGRRF